MKKLLGYLAVFLFSANALASLTISKMDMENHMRERVQAIATKADPTAFAQVQVKLKKIRSNLSFLGMETHVTPLENGQDIGPESIDTIEVKVLSKLEPFPEWLQKEIAATVEVEGIKTNITYAKPETPIKDVTAQVAEFFTQELYSSMTSSFSNLKWGVWGVGLLMLLGFGGMGYVLMSFSKKLEDILQKVIAENLVPMATALGQMAGNSGGGNKANPVVAKEKSEKAEAPRIVMPSDSKNLFEQFSEETIAALFVDCYWTGQDGYAHYLWTQLNPTQREALMKADVVDAQYYSHIISVPPTPQDYHSHAWYMSPHSKFNKADQKGLSAWVKKNLENSYVVSPLRLDYVDLSLEERLKMTAATKKGAVDMTGLPAGTPRVFARKLRISSLSEADELFLFKNYAQIHQDSRVQLKSLVWLAIAPLEKRKKILDEMDARQLAEAWIAPKVVLDELKKALGAKKLEMLEHFLKTNEASRSSDVFEYLVDAGLEASKAAPETVQEKVAKAA